MKAPYKFDISKEKPASEKTGRIWFIIFVISWCAVIAFALLLTLVIKNPNNPFIDPTNYFPIYMIGIAVIIILSLYFFWLIFKSILGCYRTNVAILAQLQQLNENLGNKKPNH